MNEQLTGFLAVDLTRALALAGDRGDLLPVDLARALSRHHHVFHAAAVGAVRTVDHAHVAL